MLVEFGRTRVLCAASASEGVPRWRKGSGLGWVTAEYAMLPSATNTRSDRESVKGRIGGRTHEISRLVGRSLRAVIDYQALGENTIVLDCDVLQADGGTRTAAITGAYVALADAVAHLKGQGALKGDPLTGSVAAISVGIIDGVPRLDLPYEEDVRAETDMNVVMTGSRLLRRGAGHRRGRGLRPGRARRPALARREGLRRPHPDPAGGARRWLRVGPGSSSPRATPRRSRRCAGSSTCYLPGIVVLGLDDVAAYDEPVEDQPTFEGNALLKARAGLAATGLPSLADDSGLCVDALNGMPGVLSARWAGRAKDDHANNLLLLEQLADVPDERRAAEFRCARGVLPPRRRASGSRQGAMPGRVIRELRGERRLRLRRALRARRPGRRRSPRPR